MTIEDKIKKLLDLASSPYEHEAKLAMERARELMAKYCVSVSTEECKPLQVETCTYTPPGRVTGANFKYLSMIACTVVKHFGVMVAIRRKSEILFYGFPTNLKLAAYACDAILNQLNAEHRVGYAKERSITYTEAFWYGASVAIEEKFKLETVQQNALVVYDLVKNRYAAEVSGASKIDFNPSSQAGQLSGERAGNAASIYKGVKSQSERGNLLC